MKAVRVCEVVKRFNGIQAVNGVSFEVESGELVCLLGPSGCGKTTTLRLIAGLEYPDGGQVWIDDTLVSDSSRRIFVPPERRGIGMVFQSYAAWPHLSVFENVAYPLRALRLPSAEIQDRVSWALSLVGISSLDRRLATDLSGGQQQRVAIARAVVHHPAVLLMDEPLSNLDAKLRAQTRYELKDLQARLNITTIYVTHDQCEAMVLSNRIILMNEGVVEQVGNAEEIYENPGKRFVGEFIGAINSFQAFPRLSNVSSPTDYQFWFAPELNSVVVGPPFPAGAGSDKPWMLMIRPEDIVLSTVTEPAGEMPPDSVAGAIEGCAYLGDHREYDVGVGRKTLLVVTPRFQKFELGISVKVTFRRGSIRLLGAG